MNVYICNIPDLTQSSFVAHIPYIYGTLRCHAETNPRVREAVRFKPPLWRPNALENLLENIEEPALVGFSTYVWNERNSLRLAKSLKERYPSTLVVFGGPQVPNRDSDYLLKHPWVDLLVHGEGEATFTALLEEALESSPDWANVHGVSFLRDGKPHFTPKRTRLKELDWSSPYLEGHFDDLLATLRSSDPNITIMACLETNRGCPYSCSFCDWGMATMSKLRRYEESRVRAEFEWVSRNEIQGIILNDANFGILPRDVGLAEYAAELKKTTGYPNTFYPLGLAKNNKDRAFAVNKIIIDNNFDPFHMNVNFSLQATSQTTLNAIARQNIPLENYRNLADRYAAEGYQLTPDLILPLPGETLQSFQDGYADLASWPQVSRIRIYPCGVLPNAPMACSEYREKWGLVTRWVPLGDQPGLRPENSKLEVEMVETVVATNTMSEDEHTQAKVFVALVNALELYGISQAVRSYLTRAKDIEPGEFYRKFWNDQLKRNGVLKRGLEAIATPVLGRTYNDEIVGSGAALSHDGKRLKHHKVLAYDALTQAHKFMAELEFFLKNLDPDFPDELIRFQKDLWILPDYEPKEVQNFQYQWNWSEYLSRGEELERRPTTVSYRPRKSWLEAGYQQGQESWESYALAKYSVDTFCVHEAVSSVQTFSESEPR